MKKILIVGAILVIATMANAMYIPELDSAQQTSKNLTSSLIPRNEIIAVNAAGNVLVSGEDDDIQPSVSRDPSGNILVSYATQHSILEQDVTLAYSADGSTWLSTGSRPPCRPDWCNATPWARYSESSYSFLSISTVR